MNDIGLRFRNIRKLLNKSQDALAAELGITKQAVSNIENSKSSLSVQILSKLLVDKKINLNYLISGIGPVFMDENIEKESLRKVILSEVENMLNNKGIK